MASLTEGITGNNTDSREEQAKNTQPLNQGAKITS